MGKRKLHNILVTGGAGFIGCNFIHYLFSLSNSGTDFFQDADFQGNVINVDSLTYAGNLESLKDVEERVRDFCNYLLENYDGKTVALVAHKAPQLALEVITKNISWEEAIDKDWRKTKSWKPGWEYEI